MARKYSQGIYEIQNWDKYAGTKNPRYLSSYEKYLFAWADRNPKVLSWSSEMIVIPYYNPVKQRKARYICDVYIKYTDNKSIIREALLEIKPLSQTKPPVRGGKRKDVYENELLTYMQNQAKWAAAMKYAEERGWDFRLITENSLFKG